MKKIMENINKKLQDIRLQRVQLQKDNSALMNLNKRLHSKKIQKTDAERILNKETKEFNRINSLTLTSLFYSVLGTKEQKLNKERREYLLAKLNYDTLTDEIQLIENKISELRLRVNTLQNVEIQYHQLLDEKELILLETKDAKANKLYLIKEGQNEINIEIKELEEALLMLNKVIKGLNEIGSKLNSAKDWGTLDILGGGLIVTAIKHGKINDTKRLISKTQFDIENFNQEMDDINSIEELNHTLEVGGLLTFSDYIFDGLIFDFTVQNRISKSRNQIKLFHSKSLDVKNRLTLILDQKVSNKERLNQQRIDLLNK